MRKTDIQPSQNQQSFDQAGGGLQDESENPRYAFTASENALLAQLCSVEVGCQAIGPRKPTTLLSTFELPLNGKLRQQGRIVIVCNTCHSKTEWCPFDSGRLRPSYVDTEMRIYCSSLVSIVSSELEEKRRPKTTLAPAGPGPPAITTEWLQDRLLSCSS